MVPLSPPYHAIVTTSTSAAATPPPQPPHHHHLHHAPPPLPAHHDRHPPHSIPTAAATTFMPCTNIITASTPPMLPPQLRHHHSDATIAAQLPHRVCLDLGLASNRGALGLTEIAPRVRLVIRITPKGAFGFDRSTTARNGFDISLPVAVCSGVVNSLCWKHGESITMQYVYCTCDQIDSIKNLLDRFSSSKPLSPLIPKYQIPVCLMFSQPDVHGHTHYEYFY
ncbi:hypothetical protein Tco_1184602 [Tanacetum coccineum]